MSRYLGVKAVKNGISLKPIEHLPTVASKFQ